MKRLLGLFGWIAFGILAARAAGQPPRTAMPSVPAATTDEAAVRAVLAQDTVRVHLPLRSAAANGLRVSAWLLSPDNDASGAVTADVPAGAHNIDLELPLPRDKSGAVESGIGWYRIGYRLDNVGGAATHGILAIGAIAPNLLELHLAKTEPVIPGKPLSVRVYAGNPVTQRPFRDVTLSATLEYDDPASKLVKPSKIDVVRAGKTGASGEALLTFPMPSAPGTDGMLKIVGTLTDAAGNKTSTAIESEIETYDQAAIHIDTDKPLHKPGETVHLRALVFDGSGHAVDKTGLTLTISDPDSKTLLEAPVTTDRYGIASYDWKTDSHLATGDYEAEFELDNSTEWGGSSREMLRMERYDLPEFTVTAGMDKGYYTQGQQPVVHVHAAYLFGKAVTQGQVRIVRAKADLSNWETQNQTPEPEKTATLDANGDATITLDTSSQSAELQDEQYRRFVDLRYRAIVTDASTGRSEPRNFTVRLTRYPVHIYLNELGTNGHEGDVMVTTSYADGLPASCRLTLDWMSKDSAPRRAATAATNQYGVAKVRLHYPAGIGSADQWGNLGLRITARDPEGRTSLSDENVRIGDASGIWIEVLHSLLKPNQPIEAVVHAQPGSTVDVDVLSGHGLLDHERLHMGSGAEPMTIRADGSFHGLVTLWAYEFESGRAHSRYSWENVDEAYRSVLYPEDRELKVKLTGLEQSYLPGADVNAGLSLRAGANASAGAFGVSVFDEAVEQRAQTEEEQNERWFGSWWDSGENIGGVSLASLNHTDMTQAIPDDLDLAAEAVLEFVNNPRGKIEAEDYDEERGSYSSMMEKALAPVSRALLDALPARFPATLAGIENITRAANLADNVLLDPWNNPYRARDSLGWEDETLEFESAGPDKQFGTDDDFSVEVARRNLFTVPGTRLSEILSRLAASGKALPANIAELKSAAHAGGLDLDATLDPDGKPYSYTLAVQGSWYLVHVFRQQNSSQTDTANQSPLWTSSYIEYFAPTEQRMRAALDAWTNSGHSFPETEAEAKAAFASGGIDTDELRDPLGDTLQLTMTQLMMYTQVERVNASSTGVNSAASKPVTRLMRAIQIAHPADANTAPARLVAQFLHPLTEQSGSDLKPVAVDDGTFNGNTGAIGGTVTDPSGAVIANTTVTIKSADGSTTIETVQSTPNGMYLAKNLASGVYEVEFQARGFQAASVREVSVHAYALTTVDMKLNVGTATETVTVTATASPGLTTESAEIAVSAKSMQGTHAQAHVSSPDRQFTPRLRHIFAETAFWAPSIETSANGRASLHFRLPDSLTTWKLHALASTADGRITAFDQTFRTFQPFFVDLDAPQVLTVGDELQLPATLRNYTQHDLDLPVTAKPSGWMSLTTPATTHAHVAAGGFASPLFGLHAIQPTDAGSLRITAADAQQGDAVEKTVRVHPDGEPLTFTSSGLLRGKETQLALDLPADAMPGATHATLLLYPNLGSQLVQAMKAALERSHGCAEQTLSSAYPSLLYLELAKAARAGGGKPDADVEAEAKDYLQLGYTQLLDYFDASGGLTYWGGKDHSPDAALTAYGIEFLNEASPYLSVDSHYVRDGMDWLVRNQQPDGSWKPRYGQTGAQENLFIAAALSAAVDDKTLPGELRARTAQAIERAKKWAGSSAAAVHDPYANALRLLLDPKSAALHNELASTAVHDRDGLHWSQYSYSPFYSWGRAGDIEATALVLTALEQQGSPADKLEDDALLYLLHSKDRYGVWMSGQATIRVLKAMLPLAIAQLKDGGHVQQISLTINGQPLTAADAGALRADPSLLGAPRSLDISAQLKPGHNELVFTGSGEVTLASVSTAADVYIPWRDRPQDKATQTGKDAGLDFAYLCGTAGGPAGNPIDCTVDARRFGSESYGMMLATVGLPPGADVDRASLGKLIDDGSIERYELEPDRLVFYLWPWRAEGEHFTFRFTPRYAIRAKAAPAKLEDYYNPDLNVVLAPRTYTISAAPDLTAQR